ncbi:proline dehydrogenase [Halobacteriales archaeon QS_3_64_16]|nr:MAG: proline dehydrogenase [Halobacteriales archaeon QS_3_64_16]
MIPPVASDFVAGESPAEAIAHVREINQGGVGGIVNLLGEHYEKRPPADADRDAYLALLADLGREEVSESISVKPSQIGLDVGEEVFEENLTRIVERASEEGVFCWIDMEDHTTTDLTLDAYERQATETDGGVGVCLQANLKRTSEDLQRLASLPGKVRLVKGAYTPPEGLSYRDRDRVSEAYEDLLEFAFREFDDGVAVGSHDPRMIDRAKELYEEHRTPFEIQMLMGVRTEAQFELAKQGYDVSQYLPYGGRWPSYFYRRMRERKENALFALRAIAGS